MEKRAFLNSLAALAATMAIDASAALPGLSTEQSIINMSHAITSLETVKVQDLFVLERPSSITGTVYAQHGSHASHASHASQDAQKDKSNKKKGKSSHQHQMQQVLRDDDNDDNDDNEDQHDMESNTCSQKNTNTSSSKSSDGISTKKIDDVFIRITDMYSQEIYYVIYNTLLLMEQNDTAYQTFIEGLNKILEPTNIKIKKWIDENIVF